MKTKPINCIGIGLAFLSTAIVWLCGAYWEYWDHDRLWMLKRTQYITLLSIESTIVSIIIGFMLIREYRVIGWIAIASGMLFLLAGILKPEL
jgi:hypothetical protein